LPAFKNQRVRFHVEEYLADLVRLRRSTDHVAALDLLLWQWLGALGVERHDPTSVGPFLSEIDEYDMKHFFFGGRVHGRFYPGVTKNKRTGKEIAGSTFNVRRNYMETFCKKNGRPDLMSKVASLPVAESDFIILLPEQLVAIIDDAPDPWERATLLVAMRYAKRAGEVRSLKIHDLNLEGARPTLRFSITKSQREEVKYKYESLPPVVAGIIMEWLEQYAHELWRYRPELEIRSVQDLLLKGRDFHLFPSRRATAAKWVNGEPRWRYVIRPMLPFQQTHDIVKRALSRLGYTDEEIKGNGVHCLRRSVACAMLADTKDIRIVQELLGHASQKTTERYVRWSIYLQMLQDYQMGGDTWFEKAVAARGATVTTLRPKVADGAA
jgi:integrase